MVLWAEPLDLAPSVIETSFRLRNIFDSLGNESVSAERNLQEEEKLHAMDSSGYFGHF